MRPYASLGRSSALCCRALLLGTMLLCGCARSPSFNVLGSYFPGWILCILAGIGVAVIVHILLNRMGWERRLPALPLFYCALTILVACVVWLIAFE